MIWHTKYNRIMKRYVTAHILKISSVIGLISFSRRKFCCFKIERCCCFAQVVVVERTDFVWSPRRKCKTGRKFREFWDLRIFYWRTVRILFAFTRPSVSLCLCVSVSHPISFCIWDKPITSFWPIKFGRREWRPNPKEFLLWLSYQKYRQRWKWPSQQCKSHMMFPPINRLFP